jgi:hypothetical protein
MDNARDLVGRNRGFLAGVLSISLSNSIWYPCWEGRKKEKNEREGGGREWVRVEGRGHDAKTFCLF